MCIRDSSWGIGVRDGRDEHAVEDLGAIVDEAQNVQENLFGGSRAPPERCV